MDLYQLKTFVAVAKERSITRAAERVHLSQPAVSAQIKALEDALGLTLFDRTARGMTLTTEGERLLLKAEQILAAHQDLMDEATRIKGKLTGKLRLGAGSNSNNEAIGRLLTVLSERSPEVEVVLKHGASVEILAGLRNGTLDAGLYNEGGDPDPDLTTLEVSRFGICVVTAHAERSRGAPDWKSLAEQPWLYPTTAACCGRFAEHLFKTHHFRPKRIISVDREEVTRALIAGGMGIGLLHDDTAKAAQSRGEIEIAFESKPTVRVLFAHLASRANDPVLSAARAILAEATSGPA